MKYKSTVSEHEINCFAMKGENALEEGRFTASFLIQETPESIKLTLKSKDTHNPLALESAVKGKPNDKVSVPSFNFLWIVDKVQLSSSDTGKVYALSEQEQATNGLLRLLHAGKSVEHARSMAAFSYHDKGILVTMKLKENTFLTEKVDPSDRSSITSVLCEIPSKKLRLHTSKPESVSGTGELNNEKKPKKGRREGKKKRE
jgi:hypothetical protein